MSEKDALWALRNVYLKLAHKHWGIYLRAKRHETKMYHLRLNAHYSEMRALAAAASINAPV